MTRLTAWIVLCGLIVGSWLRAHLHNGAPWTELPLHAVLIVGMGGFTRKIGGSGASVLAMAAAALVMGDSSSVAVCAWMALLLWLQPLWPEATLLGRTLVGALTLCGLVFLILLSTAPVSIILVLAPLLDLGGMVPEVLRSLPAEPREESRQRASRSLGCMALIGVFPLIALLWSTQRNWTDVLRASEPLGISLSSSLRELLQHSPPALLGVAFALLIGKNFRLIAWAFAGLILEAPLRAWSVAPTDPLWVFLLPVVASTFRHWIPGLVWIFLVFGWEMWAKEPVVAPRITAPDDQPDAQSLYVYDGHQEKGPLLEKASSAVVVEEDGGWRAFFVREQQIWESHSADGLVWESPERLGITGFDPEWVPELRRLLVVEADPLQDPARSSTRIVAYREEEGRWSREAVLMAGTGLVDPALRILPSGQQQLYLTTPPTRIRRALSEDGLHFQWDPSFLLVDTSVAGLWSDWLIAQRHVQGTAQLVAFHPDPLPLGLCGTGPSVAKGRLYYTRASPHCSATPTGLPWVSP